MQKLSCLQDASADRFFRNAASRRAQRKREIVVNGEVRIKRILLKNECDIARPRRIAGNVTAVDRNRTRIGTLETGNQPECRGLAGAARPQQHDKLAVIDRKRQITDRFDLPEALADMPQSDISHGRHSHGLRSGSPTRFSRQTKPIKSDRNASPPYRPHARTCSKAAAP